MRALLLASSLLFLAARQSPAQPTLTPDAPVVRLDEIGIYAVGYATRGQAEKRLPLGWSGGFEEQSGVALQPAGEYNGSPATLLHNPWRAGAGIAFQQFTFRLPKVNATRRILLRGATAMRADAIAAPGETRKSDGVTFRILVNGSRLLDEHRADAAWRPFSFDLTRFAGQTTTIRFETDPGPENNSSFDFSLWGGRELVLQGFQPKAVAHPAPPPLGLSKLSPIQSGTAAPLSGFAGTRTTLLQNDVALLRYSGADGVLEYRWRRPRTNEDAAFGALTLRATMRGGSTVQVPLATGARWEWTRPATLQKNVWQKTGDGIACVSLSKANGVTAMVRVTGKLIGKSLVLYVTCDKPWLRSLDAGGWGPTMRRRPVVAPYYSGQVHYLPKENLFVNAFLDWTHSAASSHEGTRARYDARTDKSRVALRERAVFSAAWHMAEVLPNLPNPASPHIARLRDKIVLDIWGGSFADVAKNLETLKEYGIDNCAVIIHVWQRSGYDNALPQHFPANAGQGGEAALQNLIATGKRLGFLMALHENYVDYYPNYDRFNPNEIALDPDGKRVLAWFNQSTKMQSFAVKPNAILPLAATQSPEIQRRYKPNASFLDVHSAVPPWFHVDFRAGEKGAGTFRRVWDVHRALWRYERQTHGGPVFGEGHNHWYWSGYLDGAEAQFSQGWPERHGLSAPLAVDFDLLKIHPLQFNHGMGYYERWWAGNSWGGAPPMVVLDQYRMQEVAYGHAGFLGAALYANVPFAWLEHHLLTPVTARYATAKPIGIQYQVNGKWVDGSAAAKAASWRRVRVRYNNGLTVTANDAPTPLREGAYMLPQYGWLARGAGVTAYTARRDGVVADYAETKNSVFANARRAGDWMPGLNRLRPQIADFAQTASRTFRATYRWQVGDAPGEDYGNFVHFTQKGAPNEGIVFQQDHALPRPSSSWKSGETIDDGPHTIRIPDTVADGDYEWKIGLFKAGGGRVSLEGADDGNSRIRLGVLRVRDGGQTISFEPERATPDDRAKLYRRNVNETGKVVDFGPLRTNGSVLVRREGSGKNAAWVLRALPRRGDFTVQLSAARFGKPTTVRCISGASPTVTPQAIASKARGGWWRLPLNGAREYRWK